MTSPKPRPVRRKNGIVRVRIQTKVSANMLKEISELAHEEASENISHMVRILLQEALYSRKYGKPLK